MAKDSYNIDDILSEVKKRKVENENEIKNDSVKAEQSNKEAQNTEIKDKIDNKKSENPIKDTHKSIVNDDNKNHKNDVKKDLDEPKAEVVKKVENNEQLEKQLDKKQENPKNEENVADNTDKKDDKKPQNPMLTATDKDFEDVTSYAKKFNLGDLSIAEYDEVDQELLGKTKKSKTLRILIVVLCLLLVIAIACGVYLNTMLNKISSDENNQNSELILDDKVNEFPTIYEAEASKISSFKDMIQQWYYNGEPAKSSDVLNIMLIGEDVNTGNRGNGEIVESGVRADSVIIVSVNRQTKQISLTSVLRDTYAYYETEPGNKKTGEFGKINGAMSSGDVHAYINAVERLYKINIDNYVIVNFESFKSIINALGGVTLELTEAEINHVNNNPQYYGGVKIKKKFEGSKGMQKLNGIEALTYCRIRHLDSDNMRANRQKTCLIQIFNELKDSSKVQLVNVITKLLPYVKTGLTKDQILDIVGIALPEGWLQYEIRINTVPQYRINEKGAGGSYYGAWCWKSDFPQDAYNLQYYIYGRTNIVLAKTRVDVIHCKEEGFFEKGSPAVKATFENLHYGEVSTFEDTTVIKLKPGVEDKEDKTTTKNKETTTKEEPATVKEKTTAKKETTTAENKTTTTTEKQTQPSTQAPTEPKIEQTTKAPVVESTQAPKPEPTQPASEPNPKPVEPTPEPEVNAPAA